MYQRKLASDGMAVYYKDNKRVRKDQVPTDELARLTVDDPVAPSAKVEIGETCLFCGNPGTKVRFVNMKTVHVCDDDYLTQTLGKIVMKLNEEAV